MKNWRKKLENSRTLDNFFSTIKLLSVLIFLLIIFSKINESKNTEMVFFVLIIIVTYGAVRFYNSISRKSKIQKEELINEITNRFPEKTTEFQAAALSLLENSRRHSGKADENQFFMFLTLATTALFMIFAGFIADIDNRTILSARDLNDKEENLVNNLRDMEREFNRFQYVSPRSQSSSYPPADADLPRRAAPGASDGKISTDTLKSDAQSDSNESLPSFSDRITAYKLAHSTIQEQLSNIKDQQREAREISINRDRELVNGNMRMISAIVLRISFGAVAIYLSIVLLRAYRYHTTAASAYIAKYHALCLSDVDPQAFLLRSISLTVENISFGTDPRHPFVEILDLVTGAFNSIKKNDKESKINIETNK